MTKLDTRFRALATRLINKYGKSITLTSITTGSYNPATGSVINTTSAASVKAIVEDYSYRDSGTGFADGLVKIGDKKFTVAAIDLSSSPKPGDTITLGSATYSVIRVIETWSGEQIASYELQGRIQ